MESKELIAAKEYLYERYSPGRFEFKNLYNIPGAFGDESNKLYVIEFIDSKMKHSKVLEISVSKKELLKEGTYIRSDP